MSRLSNAIRMYLLLQSRSFMQVKEIAEILGVSEKMVKEYRRDLEEAEIYIGSNRGRNGGYYLITKTKLDGINITGEEIEALKMANEAIKNANYFYSYNFESLSSKILNYERSFQDKYYYNKKIPPTNEVIKREKEVWKKLNISITQKNKFKIKYKTLGNEKLLVNERIIHPYGIFNYAGAAYFYGYCELRKEVRYFKLSRTIECEVLSEKFSINTKVDIEKIIENSFGIYNDKLLNVKLKIYYPMSEIIKEKQISKKQKVEQIDDNTIYFEAKMKGYKEIKSWIMSMGSTVEVIEPVDLKREILEEAKKIICNYK